MPMPEPIRRTTFTWDPARESRASIWNRIKRHVQGELDRIEAQHRLPRRIDQHETSPLHARHRQMLEDYEHGFLDVPGLARQHGLNRARVREILRSERHWQALAERLGGLRHDAGRWPSRHLPERALGTPRTKSILPDP